MAEMNEGMNNHKYEIRELKKQTNNGTDLNAKLDGMHSSLRHHAKALTSMHSTLSKFDDYPTAAGSKMHIDPESTSGILSVTYERNDIRAYTAHRVQRIHDARSRTLREHIPEGNHDGRSQGRKQVRV